MNWRHPEDSHGELGCVAGPFGPPRTRVQIQRWPVKDQAYEASDRNKDCAGTRDWSHRILAKKEPVSILLPDRKIFVRLNSEGVG